MFIYIMALATLIVIMFVAFYVIFRNVKRGRVSKSNEYNVLFDEDTVVDQLITQLIEKNETQENKENILKTKEEILATFISLHRSGSFCSRLTEEQIIYFVNKKLNMEKS